MGRKSRAPLIRECAAAGLSAREAAEALGLKISTVYYCCSSNKIKMRDERPERMRKLHQNPDFAAKIKANAEASAERMRKMQRDPARNPLVLLTPDERIAYKKLKRKRYTRADALRAIGRADLIREAAE